MPTTSTRLSDVVVPSVFLPYVRQQITVKSALRRSGIIQPDPQIDALAKGAGKTFDLPFWNNLSGDSDVSSDDPDAHSTPAKIDAGRDVCIKHNRAKSWSTMDLAGELAGDDPAMVIADGVTEFWTQNEQALLVASLKGILADNVANDGGSMVKNVATDAVGAIAAAEKMSADVVIDARQTMGDAGNKLTAVAFHSVVYSNLLKLNLISFQPTNVQDIGWGTYLGMTVIVDDGLPAVAGTNRITYTSVLFGPGAVGFGEGERKTPMEVIRVPDAGNGSGMEVLHHRRAFILHVRGVKWVGGSMAGISPTTAELALAANWSRVYDRKNVRLAFIKTNG